MMNPVSAVRLPAFCSFTEMSPSLPAAPDAGPRSRHSQMRRVPGGRNGIKSR